jgi:catechol 2,3-dioxygenase-like lactoylglutathione lyase family enzyme
MAIKFERRSLAVVPLLFLGTAIRSQSPTPTAPAFEARGAFAAIVVRDLDGSVNWYESNLGLHLVKRGKSPRLPAETAVLKGHGLFIELIHHDGKQLPRIENEAPVPRLIKAGVIVPKKDFDSIAAYLPKRGVEIRIFEDLEMRVRSFLLKDNDGNLIQFFTEE